MLDFVGDKEARRNLLVEATVFKIVNRQKYLETSQDEVVEKDDVIVSLLADLQQEQDQESEKLVNELQDKVSFSHLHLLTLAKKTLSRFTVFLLLLVLSGDSTVVLSPFTFSDTSKKSLSFYSVSTSACAVGRLNS